MQIHPGSSHGCDGSKFVDSTRWFFHTFLFFTGNSACEARGASGPGAAHGYHERTLLDLNDKIRDYTPQPALSQEGMSENSTDHAQGDYPRDIFSLEQRRKGAIILPPHDKVIQEKYDQHD